MADVSTSNAVALALKDLLKPGYRVKVIRDSAGSNGFARVGRYKFPLPEELFDWLERAERASPVDPISFRVALPDEWLKQPLEERKKPVSEEQVSLVA